MTPRIVTAAIIRRDGRILLARRGSGPHQGKWEFPGGKLEHGESEEECLARELREELGIDARVGRFVAESLYDYGRGSILLRAYEVEYPSGDITPVDHDLVEWLLPREIESYDLLPADVPIAQAIRIGVSKNS